MLNITDLWRKTYPGAGVGCMVLNHVKNPERCEELEDGKRRLEAELRATVTRKEELAGQSPIRIYTDYYKRYKKTYHVLHQLESIIFKGKRIPRVAGLVEAMFMAELKNGLLTAGHDYDALRMPLKLDVAAGHEAYILINGQEQIVKPGDMMMADTEGIISSIIHGPDARTRIMPGTRKVLYVIYAPAGIAKEAVLHHLSDIYSYARLVSPSAEMELQEVYTGS